MKKALVVIRHMQTAKKTIFLHLLFRLNFKRAIATNEKTYDGIERKNSFTQS